MKRLGKKPVLLKRDIPGFLANRIQHALMREALSLVEKGIATPEDVDDAVRYGFGFRYIASGPLRQKDLTDWIRSMRREWPYIPISAMIPPRARTSVTKWSRGI